MNAATLITRVRFAFFEMACSPPAYLAYSGQFQTPGLVRIAPS